MLEQHTEDRPKQLKMVEIERKVEDLKSTNGTYVNGIKVEQKHPLKNGDTVSLSTLVSFVVEINKRF